MKKQLFLILSVGCVLNNISADELRDESKECKSYRLRWSPIAFKNDIKDGIDSTEKINGVNLFNILANSERYLTEDYKMANVSDVKFDGIFVVRQSEDGEFSKGTDFSTFDRKIFEKYFFDYESKRKLQASSDSDHISFIEDIQRPNCVLCSFGEKDQVIVTNAQGTPKEVCYLLKKTKDLEAKERRLFELRIKDSESIEEYVELQEIRKELPRKRKEVKDLQKQLLKKV